MRPVGGLSSEGNATGSHTDPVGRIQMVGTCSYFLFAKFRPLTLEFALVKITRIVRNCCGLFSISFNREISICKLLLLCLSLLSV